MLGGFLLLGGRMADLLGRRRVLLAGLALFSAASLLAGVAGSAGLLIGARALQGFGAALVPPAALSILAVTFKEGAERNRALGLYGAVTGISASVGVIASGLLTERPRLALGLLHQCAGRRPSHRAWRRSSCPLTRPDRAASKRFDVAGAVTVTGGLLLLVYALNRGTDDGWGSGSTLGLFAASAVLLSAFVADRSAVPVTARARLGGAQPHAGGGEPLRVLPVRSVLRLHLPRLAADAAGARLFADEDGRRLAGHDGDVVRRGRGSPEPSSSAVVGVRRLLVAGFTLLAIAALLLTRIPAGGHYATDLLPALILAGLAGGISAPAIQIGALSGVAHSMTGVASGLVETMREIGGGVVVAVVRPSSSPGPAPRGRCQLGGPRTGGGHAFHTAFWVMFAVAALGALTAAIAFPRSTTRQAGLEPAMSPDSIVPQPEARG